MKPLQDADEGLATGLPPQTPTFAATPLPIGQFIPMTLVLVNESLCSSMLLPFVGLLVAHLQGKPPDEAGYLSGVLVGVFMLGQVASARTWGWISDQYGRRFPLISGLFTSGIMMLCFGLSTSVWQCALARFFQGLFNGNVLVAKTMIADLTDKTNEAKGFSFVILCYAVGMLVGPALGGLLYDPTNSGPLSVLHLKNNGIFASNPALLPSLCSMCFAFAGALTCIFCLSETNPTTRPFPRWVSAVFCCFHRCPTKKRGSCDDVCKAAQSHSYSIQPPMLGSDGVLDNEDTPRLCRRSPYVKIVEVESPHIVPFHRDFVVALSASEVTDSSQKFGFSDAFHLGATRAVVFQVMLLGSADTIMKDCFPLWAISSTAVGGLGYQASDVGLILLLNSIPCFAANLLFHSACEHYPNRMDLFRVSTVMTGMSVSIISFASYFDARCALLVVVVCTSLRQFFCSWCYSLNTMFAARSAPPGHVGTFMGIHQTCGSLARGVIPFVATPIYAWSISVPRTFPINHGLVFFLSFMLFAGCWWSSYTAARQR